MYVEVTVIYFAVAQEIACTTTTSMEMIVKVKCFAIIHISSYVKNIITLIMCTVIKHIPHQYLLKGLRI